MLQLKKVGYRRKDFEDLSHLLHAGMDIVFKECGGECEGCRHFNAVYN